MADGPITLPWEQPQASPDQTPSPTPPDQSQGSAAAAIQDFIKNPDSIPSQGSQDGSIVQGAPNQTGGMGGGDKVADDIVQGIGEAPAAIGRAAAKTVVATAHTVDKAIIAASEAMGDTPQDHGYVYDWARANLDLQVSDAAKPQSNTGALTEGATQFIAGLAGISKVTKAYGLMSDAGRLLKNAVDAGLTGAVAFDPYEKRLSSLLEEHASLRNPVANFLAADPRDSETDARFKAFLENAGLGAAADGLFGVLSKFREARPIAQAGNGAKAARMMDEAVQQAHGAPLEPTGAPKNIATATVPPAPNGEPEITKVLDHSKDVPYAGGSANDDSKVYVDRGIPTSMDFGNGVTSNPVETVGIHESTEKALRDKGATYEEAHKVATQTERDEVEKRGGDWATYSKNLEPYIQAARNKAQEGVAQVPQDLDKSIYTGDDKKLVGGAELAVDWSNGAGKPALNTGRDISGFSGSIAGAPALPDTAEQTLDRLTQQIHNQNNSDWFGPSRQFNYDHFQQFTAARVIQSVANSLPANVTASESRAATEAMADMLSSKQDTLVQALSAHAQNADAIARTLVAGKQYMQFLGNNLAEMARSRITSMLNGGDGVKELEAMKGMYAHLNEITGQVKQIQKGAARATGAGNIDIKPIDLDPKTAEMLGYANTPKQVVKMIQAAQSPLAKSINILNELHINAMLSGLRSTAVHAMGVFSNSVLMPTEKYLLGGTLRALTGDVSTLRQGAGYAIGLWKSIGDSVSATARVLWNEAPELEHGGLVETPPAIRAETFGFNPVDTVGQIINGVGSFVRLNTRFRMGMDEITKQLNYRAFAYGKAFNDGINHGLSGDALAQHCEAEVSGSIADTGKGEMPDALDWARQSTFTQPVPPDTITGGINRFLAQHPAGRLLIPFIKVPYNLLNSGALARTPGLNMIREGMRDDLMGNNGKSAADLARGKLMTGTALITGAAWYAASGVLTGSGPSNPEARKQLMNTGWQPYSVKQSDGTYVSYARAEPFATVLGIISDLTETYAHQQQGESEGLTLGLATAVSKNLMSKLYLQGLAQGIDGLSDPDRQFPRWLKQFSESFVPTFGADGTSAIGAGDPYIREVRSALDAVRSKIPGLSQDLPPVRNLVGDPVQNKYGVGVNGWDPLTVTHSLDEPWAKEIGRLQAPISSLPQKEGKVTLTTQQRDRWGQILQETRFGGKTLKESLNELVQSDHYQHQMTDNSIDYEGSRAKAIDNIVRLYRNLGMKKLMGEDKGLADMVKQDRMNAALQNFMPGQVNPQKAGTP